uniref:PHD-type domain-containing protein n=1 Tax=Macrostomum lignano TaxID=282301 RepID=A0A1I8I745_9PLAT
MIAAVAGPAPGRKSLTAAAEESVAVAELCALADELEAAPRTDRLVLGSYSRRCSHAGASAGSQVGGGAPVFLRKHSRQAGQVAQPRFHPAVPPGQQGDGDGGSGQQQQGHNHYASDGAGALRPGAGGAIPAGLESDSCRSAVDAATGAGRQTALADAAKTDLLRPGVDASSRLFWRKSPARRQRPERQTRSGSAAVPQPTPSGTRPGNAATHQRPIVVQHSPADGSIRSVANRRVIAWQSGLASRVPQMPAGAIDIRDELIVQPCGCRRSGGESGWRSAHQPAAAGVTAGADATRAGARLGAHLSDGGDSADAAEFAAKYQSAPCDRDPGPQTVLQAESADGHRPCRQKFSPPSQAVPSNCQTSAGQESATPSQCSDRSHSPPAVRQTGLPSQPCSPPQSQASPGSTRPLPQREGQPPPPSTGSLSRSRPSLPTGAGSNRQCRMPESKKAFRAAVEQSDQGSWCKGEPNRLALMMQAEAGHRQLGVSSSANKTSRIVTIAGVITVQYSVIASSLQLVTQRAPGKRQIKLVSAVDFQLFEDLEDDSDNEFKAKVNGRSSDIDDEDSDEEAEDDNDNNNPDASKDAASNASSSLNSEKSKLGEEKEDNDSDNESDTTEETDDSEDGDIDSSSTGSAKDQEGNSKTTSSKGGDLRALIDGVVASSSRGGDDANDDNDRTSSSDEDWLEGRKKRQQQKKQQKGQASGRKNSKAQQHDSDASEDAMFSEIKPRKKSSRRTAKTAKTVDATQKHDNATDTKESAAALAAATAAAIKKVERLTCMVCLSNRSDPENELVECDSCHVTVHEACYGLADSQSLCSTGSSASTEPWFCDACAAGIASPSCQLCPVAGGVFKPTEDGRWVHLVCALYTPDVAFNDVDSLTDVTLTELKPRFWGAKECVYCSDRVYAYTGVCIGCDAGMCRCCFHVTCAQREGLLSEPAAAAAAAEDADEIADPFYAQCRQHTDPFVAKQRRKAYSTAFSRQRAAVKNATELKSLSSSVGDRIARKLAKRRSICAAKLAVKRPYFIPQQKQPLFLEFSPHAVRLFAKKAEILGVGAGPVGEQGGSLQVTGQERTAAQTGLPVFCPEFVQHFFDRETRIVSMNKQLADLNAQEAELIERQSAETLRYSNAETAYQTCQNRLKTCRSEFAAVWDALLGCLATGSASVAMPLRLSNALEGVSASAGDAGTNVDHPIGEGDEDSSTITAAANAGGAPVKVGDLAAKAAALRRLNECTVCKAKKDQHLMVQCDACQLYYHIGCLDPPLTRVPKKTKLYGWECSVCVKDNSSDEAAEEAEAGIAEQQPNEALPTRRLRQKPAKLIAEESAGSTSAAVRAGGRTNNNRKKSQQQKQQEKLRKIEPQAEQLTVKLESSAADSQQQPELQTVASAASSIFCSNANATAITAVATLATKTEPVAVVTKTITTAASNKKRGENDSTASVSAEEGINSVEVFDEGPLEIEYLKSDTTVSSDDEADECTDDEAGDVGVEVIDEFRLEPEQQDRVEELAKEAPSPSPQPRKVLFKSGNTVPCYLMHTLTPEERRRVEAESAALRAARAAELQQQQQIEPPSPSALNPSSAQPTKIIFEQKTNAVQLSKQQQQQPPSQSSGTDALASVSKETVISVTKDALKSVSKDTAAPVSKVAATSAVNDAAVKTVTKVTVSSVSKHAKESGSKTKVSWAAVSQKSSPSLATVSKDADEERRRRKREKRQRLEEKEAATEAAERAERERRRLRKLEKLKKGQAEMMTSQESKPPPTLQQQQQQQPHARHQHNPNPQSRSHQHPPTASDQRKRHRSRSPTSVEHQQHLPSPSSKKSRPSMPPPLPPRDLAQRQQWQEMKARIEQERAKSRQQQQQGSTNSNNSAMTTLGPAKHSQVTVAKQVARRTPVQPTASGGPREDDILQFMLHRPKKLPQQLASRSGGASLPVAASPQKPRGFSQLVSGRAAAAAAAASSNSSSGASKAAKASAPSYLPPPVKVATASVMHRTQQQQQQQLLNKTTAAAEAASSSSSSSTSSSASSDEDESGKVVTAAKEQLQDRKYNHLVKDIFGDD